MRLVIDIETNSLVNPIHIWVIVCKDIDSGELHIFRNVTEDENAKGSYRSLIQNASLIIAHNLLGFDGPVSDRLLGTNICKDVSRCCDTLIASRLIDYPRVKHSIEDYGQEFGLGKIEFNNWKQYSKEMEEYCIRDVDICEKIYRKYERYINNDNHRSSIIMEHRFQLIINDLCDNGFSFNTKRARELLDRVTANLHELDQKIGKEFQPKEVLIREFTPRATKYGTISKTSVPRSLWDKIHEYEVGKTYRHTKMVPFNPSSHKQLIEVLHEAGWEPVEKTQTHIDTERELNRAKRPHKEEGSVDIESVRAKLVILAKYGWKINEANLSTLPETAPSPARSLAKRILLESRRRTLTEWLGLVDPDTNRIHGKFQGIGAWTHRMAHQSPNTANIPNEFDTAGKVKLLGKEMRQLWQAPRNRLLVGVDAEGIQLRIFAHYIDDPEFTDALVKGKKDDKTDPHSLNQRILGGVCKSRAAAKRFIYALLLGAGMSKLAQILECSIPETQEALDRLIQRYQGWAYLKEKIIPKDARNGYFVGLDGRKVRIPGDTVSERRHLAMSGYLQCGEAVCMKLATLKWYEQLNNLVKDYPRLRWLLVNFVHDEWQTEVNNDVDLALKIAQIQSDALRSVGEELGLKCPLAGSYWNDDHHEHTIGTNWYQTH